MIDARELKLGNLILFEDKIEIITNIQDHCVLIKDYWGTPLVEKIFPIPLTPAILLASGFKPFHQFDMSDGNWKIKTDQHDFIVTYLHGKYIATIYFQVPIPSLHILQNLFYCLCGKELEIKL